MNECRIKRDELDHDTKQGQWKEHPEESPDTDAIAKSANDAFRRAKSAFETLKSAEEANAAIDKKMEAGNKI